MRKIVTVSVRYLYANITISSRTIAVNRTLSCVPSYDIRYDIGYDIPRKIVRYLPLNRTISKGAWRTYARALTRVTGPTHSGSLFHHAQITPPHCH